MNTEIAVNIIDCNIPMLISNNDLKTWKVYQDYDKNTIKIGLTGDTIDLKELESGHYGIDLGGKEDDDKLNECFYGLSEETAPERFKKIKKVHRVLGHPVQDKMLQLYKNRGSCDKKVGNMIKKVSQNCHICRKYSRKQPRPKVGLPKATSVNETVSLDLKNVSSLIKDPKDKRHVLYICLLYTSDAADE